jgi:hypothetical protein
MGPSIDRHGRATVTRPDRPSAGGIVDKRFVYFYLLRPFPRQVQEIVPAHVQYWASLRLAEYRGGPFADRSGGLIEFLSPDLRSATEIVGRDPFAVNRLVEASWLKEWVPE